MLFFYRQSVDVVRTEEITSRTNYTRQLHYTTTPMKWHVICREKPLKGADKLPGEQFSRQIELPRERLPGITSPGSYTAPTHLFAGSLLSPGRLAVAYKLQLPAM